MNYQNHYDVLIERARNRKIDGYAEDHHVLPRCLGGGGEKTNLVSLTAEEHYAAHLLLAKIHRTEPRLIYAALMMTVSNGSHIRSKNKAYGWVRRASARACSLRPVSGEQREAQRKRQTGMKRDPEVGKKISAALTGRVMTPEWKANLSNAKKGKPSPLIGISLSEETKAKIREARKHQPVVFGRTHTDASKAKIGAASRTRVCSDETRKKLQLASAGRFCTIETRAKISAINKGKTVSSETRAKISAARNGATASEETRAKMRAAHIGMIDRRTPEQRRAGALKAWQTKQANREARA